jgi:hypothetical protein
MHAQYHIYVLFMFIDSLLQTSALRVSPMQNKVQGLPPVSNRGLDRNFYGVLLFGVVLWFGVM